MCWPLIVMLAPISAVCLLILAMLFEVLRLDFAERRKERNRG